MPSVGMQMPKLFLRGSLCNCTMKNLTPQEVAEVDQIIDELKDDPLLQASRVEFRNALKYTIKGDYQDVDAADAEFQISLWRAVVAAKFGWGDHPPSEQTFNDPIQRKKFFQTWAFNYLRQILTENRRSFITNTEIIFKPVFDIVVSEVVRILGKLGKVETNGKNTCEVSADLYMCPSDSINQLSDLKLKYFNKGVEIEVLDDKVVVNDSSNGDREVTQVKTQTLVNMASINTDDDERSKCQEIADINAAGFQDPDLMSEFYESLSDNAQRVLRVMTNPPDGYVEEYGEKIAKKYIGEYLGLTAKEIKLIWSELRLIYASVIGVPG